MKSVLVVDDNLTNLKLASAQLYGKYDVFLAKSGEAALKICFCKKPDVILLDVDMPDMDGFQTIARLKNDPALRCIPVIFFTTLSDKDTEYKCRASGGCGFLAKPAAACDLQEKINAAFEFGEGALCKTA